MKNKGLNRNIFTAKNWIFAFLTVLALNVNLSIPKDNQFDSFLRVLNAFRGNNILNFILFFIISLFYKKAFGVYNTYFIKSERFSIYMPAMLVSLFMVIGISFKLDNSWKLIWGDASKVTKAIIVFSGYFLLFLSIITIIFYYLDQYIKNSYNCNICFTPPPSFSLRNNWVKQYIYFLKQKPFWGAFFTLFIAYIPYIIFSYPGIFMGDTPNQIAQCFNLEESTSNYLNLISDNIKLNNHHPVFHSLLIHFFIMVGKTCFNSYNVGIFLYCVFQLIIILFILALLIKLYIQLNLNIYYILFTIIYFAFSPRIQNYMFLITKDVLFSAFLLLFILVYCNTSKGLLKRALLTLSLLCIVFFRNDGKYIIFLTVFITGILKKDLRKQMLFILIGTICLTALFNKIILPSFQITPSSRREMLSIPFQQTARYIRDANTDVTSDEKKAISQILDYDNLAEKYDPNLADPVKATFNEFASTDDIKQYFQCWFRMFLKHPGIYLQAILNNKYRFFYPTPITNTYSYSWSMRQMERTNMLTVNEVNTNFSYPHQLNVYRNIYEQFRETIFNIPVLSIFLSSATYTWLLILWTFYCIKHKNIVSIVYIIPLYTQLFIAMFGPCNGHYFRYLYPIAFCLPPSITLGFQALISSFKEGKINEKVWHI